MRRRGAGITVLELVIVSAILIVVLAAVWTLFIDSANALQFGFARSSLDMHSRRVLRRLETELRSSGADRDGGDRVVSHPIAFHTAQSSLQFQTRLDLQDEDTDWSTPITYEVQQEADGNNLVRIQDGVTEVLARRVQNFHCTRAQATNLIEVFLTLGGTADGDDTLAARTATIKVHLRNLAKLAP